MTLRTRLFLLFAGLAAALVVAQWFWVRSLARGLQEEVGAVAVSVGETVAAVVRDLGPGAGAVESRDVRVRRIGEEPVPVEVRRLVERITTETTDCEAGADCAEGPTEVRSVLSSTASWVFDVDGDAAGPRHLVLHMESLDGENPPPLHYEFRTDVEGPVAFVVPDPDLAGRTGESAGTAPGPPRVRERRIRHRVAGALSSDLASIHRIPLPEGGIREQLDAFAQRSLVGAGLLLAVGVGLAAVVAQRVSAPLGRLASAAREIGAGRLGWQVDPGRETGEVGEAIAAFNQMSRRLEELDTRTRSLEQERQLAEIGEIARGLAHALRNPLNALGLAVDSLALEAPSPSAGASGSAAAAARAREQIRRVDAAVRSFLVLASEGAGEVAPADLAQLVRDVALEAHQDAAGRVRVRVVAPDPVPLDVVEAEIRAVVQALVVNAIEASPEGEVVEIRVARPRASDAGAVVEVLDRGPGLPVSVRDRLFSPHVSTKSHGSGMGLFLAHRIATGRYGGRLELRDRDEGGTVADLVLGRRGDRGRRSTDV